MTWKINTSARRKDWLIVIGPYVEEFVTALKAGISAPMRTWDATGKYWCVYESCRAKLEAIIARFSTPS